MLKGGFGYFTQDIFKLNQSSLQAGLIMRLINNKDCWMSIMFAFSHCQLASFVC